MKTRVSKDGIEYVIVLKCPWCGAVTTDYNEKRTQVMERCPECDTEYRQGENWCWVSRTRLDMRNKNADKDLKI